MIFHHFRLEGGGLVGDKVGGGQVGVVRVVVRREVSTLRLHNEGG